MSGAKHSFAEPPPERHSEIWRNYQAAQTLLADAPEGLRTDEVAVKNHEEFFADLRVTFVALNQLCQKVHEFAWDSSPQHREWRALAAQLAGDS